MQVVDLSLDGAEETVESCFTLASCSSILRKQWSIFCVFSWPPWCPLVMQAFAPQVRLIEADRGHAIAVQCNVQDDAAQEAAFERHLAAWDCLDVGILNAGIFEKGMSMMQADVSMARFMHRPAGWP